MIEMQENLQASEKLLLKSFDEICLILATCKTAKDAQNFLECLCTESEKFDFAKRWLSVKELYKGTPQRTIAKKFNMSLCKITRGSRELCKKDSAFKKILERERITQ